MLGFNHNLSEEQTSSTDSSEDNVDLILDPPTRFLSFSPCPFLSNECGDTDEAPDCNLRVSPKDPSESGYEPRITLRTRVSQISLTNSQKSVFDSYLKSYKDDFNHFISVVQDEIKPFRAFLIHCASEMKEHHFIRLLDFYYPSVKENEPTYRQNIYFRDKLLTFNRLCCGNSDINVSIYSKVFDPRLSPTLSSPTKRDKISQLFKEATIEFLKKNGWWEKFKTHPDQFVLSAQEWIKSELTPFSKKLDF